MHITLISHFEQHTDWLDQLRHALDQQTLRNGELVVWVRDKGIPTQNLPVAQLRWLARTYNLSLRWSWRHRSAAAPDEALHIPDEQRLRDASRSVSGRRVLSVHGCAAANELLMAYPGDQVLASPWSHSANKPTSAPLLQRVTVRQLAARFPNRLHLVSGLTPDDLSDLRAVPLASLAFQGVFVRDPATCLSQLLERLRAASSPL